MRKQCSTYLHILNGALDVGLGKPLKLFVKLKISPLGQKEVLQSLSPLYKTRATQCKHICVCSLVADRPDPNICSLLTYDGDMVV